MNSRRYAIDCPYASKLFRILPIQTFLRCDYYSTCISILQENSGKKPYKNRATEIG